MASNRNLRSAAKAKKDEFYTQLADIENELRHYKDFFKDKIVFCNCDDPYESNFFKFFAMNFNSLGLKKLITTCYAASPVTGSEFPYFVNKSGQLAFWPAAGAVPLQGGRRPYKVEINAVTDENGDGRTDLADVEYLMRSRKNIMTLLEGDGDFRSDECVELLKQADVVVTNPPFSLFREYVAQLMEYDKKFLIIGNKNAITYKEIFPLIKGNKLWIGFMPMSHDMLFCVPPDNANNLLSFGKLGSQYRIVNGEVRARSAAIWFTNIDHNKRHEKLILYKYYFGNEKEYLKYDNYDAINVDKVVNIPCDYYGFMGVPITFLDKYNPEQFELVGIMNTGELNLGIRYANTPHGRPLVNGKELYLRILIRRKGEIE